MFPNSRWLSINSVTRDLSRFSPTQSRSQIPLNFFPPIFTPYGAKFHDENYRHTDLQDNGIKDARDTTILEGFEKCGCSMAQKVTPRADVAHVALMESRQQLKSSDNVLYSQKYLDLIFLGCLSLFRYLRSGEVYCGNTLDKLAINSGFKTLGFLTVIKASPLNCWIVMDDWHFSFLFTPTWRGVSGTQRIFTNICKNVFFSLWIVT